MRAVVLAVVVLLSYPGVSLVLVRMGLIEMPGTPLELLSPASSADGASSSRTSWQLAERASRALGANDELSELGPAAATAAAARLSVFVAAWDFEVLSSGIAFPAPPVIIIARERCESGSPCGPGAPGLTLWISVRSVSAGSAVVDVAWRRGTRDRVQDGWRFELARRSGQWVAVSGGYAQ